MATFVMFDEFILDLGDEIHDMAADTFKFGLVTSAAAPAATTATPRWGDFSANEVTTGTSYSAGGVSMTGQLWQEDGTDTELELNSFTINQDASGFTNARYGILYNDTAAADQAVGFVDFGSDQSIQSGDLVIKFSSIASGSPGRVFYCSST